MIVAFQVLYVPETRRMTFQTSSEIQRPEDIFFCDDAEQAAVVGNEGLAQAQLPEHVHHRLHGGLGAVSGCGG